MKKYKKIVFVHDEPVILAGLLKELEIKGISFTVEEADVLRKEAEGRKRAEESLRRARKNIEKMNSAMQVLLEKRSEDRADLEETILLNVKKLILPIIEKMRGNIKENDRDALINILEENIRGIISPFSVRLTSEACNLTASELEIANMIREGMTTAEIARIRRLSRRTVETHRENIRRKLGLNNTNQNLRSYLLSMEK